VKPVAVIDLGTNSTNLLVSDGAELYDRTTTVTRLGQGVHATRTLHPEAIERTLTALAAYRARCDELGVERLRVAATSACRDALNRDEFFDRAEAVLRVRPELMAGEDEGRFAFAGAMARLEVEHPAVVIDIGGGSTEVMLGDSRGELLMARSIDIGALRLTESELHGDPPRPEELTNAIGAAFDAFNDVVLEFPAVLEASTLVGIGGAVNTVGRVELGAYEAELHGLRLSRATVEEIFRMLATEPLAERVHNPGLAADRAEIIVGGMCALVAIMRRLQVDEIVVARSGLMDGLAHALIGERDRMAGAQAP
jgi:exopolyphosphatase / guanosine-5'-triphosphate,3'-diphosphate pyrophosphatase